MLCCSSLLVNEANSYLNRIVPNARGEAAKLVEGARAYKEQVVKQAEGVAQNFVDVYNSYKDNKEVTRRRIYLETLREVLEGENKIILDDAGGQGVVINGLIIAVTSFIQELLQIQLIDI